MLFSMAPPRASKGPLVYLLLGLGHVGVSIGAVRRDEHVIASAIDIFAQMVDLA